MYYNTQPTQELHRTLGQIQLHYAFLKSQSHDAWMLFSDTLPWQPYNDSQFKHMVMLGRIQSAKITLHSGNHMNGTIILWNIQTLLNISAL